MNTRLKLVSHNKEIVPQKSRANLRLVNSQDFINEEKNKTLHDGFKSFLTKIKSKINFDNHFNTLNEVVLAEISTINDGARIVKKGNIIAAQTIVKNSVPELDSWHTVMEMSASPENEIRAKTWLYKELINIKIHFTDANIGA